MKNVFLIFSPLFFFISCQNKKYINYCGADYRKTKLSDSLGNPLDTLINISISHCSFDKLEIEYNTLIKNKYNNLHDTLPNIIDVSTLKIQKLKAEYKLIIYELINNRKEYVSHERSSLGEVLAKNHIINIHINNPNIDEMYVDFKFINNQLELKKIYMKQHYQNYLEYINEVDTTLVYKNNSILTIDDFFEILNRHIPKEIITDSTAYKQSLPQ